MQATSIADKKRLTLPFLEKAGLVPTSLVDDLDEYLAALLVAAGDRIKVAGDILEFSDFFIADDELIYEENAFAKRLTQTTCRRAPPRSLPPCPGRHRELRSRRTGSALMRDFVAAEDIKIGDVIHALRVAVTGRSVGFGMFEILEVLGRERCSATNRPGPDSRYGFLICRITLQRRGEP